MSSGIDADQPVGGTLVAVMADIIVTGVTVKRMTAASFLPFLKTIQNLIRVFM